MLKANYFNPKPIHVSEASWTEIEGSIGIFLELRDTNYPGATYRLIHDAKSDQLKGQYFQPLHDRTYQVAFDRVPRP